MNTQEGPKGRLSRSPRVGHLDLRRGAGGGSTSEIEHQLAHMEREALVHAHHLRSLEYVTKAGMVAISNITALEAVLRVSVPNASGRLKLVGDFATRAMAREIEGLLP